MTLSERAEKILQTLVDSRANQLDFNPAEFIESELRAAVDQQRKRDHMPDGPCCAAMARAKAEAYEELLRIGDDNKPQFKDIHPQLQWFLGLIRSRAEEVRKG